jgi:hypothetical protein
MFGAPDGPAELVEFGTAGLMRGEFAPRPFRRHWIILEI